jgi:hypothetical protein
MSHSSSWWRRIAAAAEDRIGSRGYGRIGNQGCDKDCGYCGKIHRKGDCPAYGKRCTKCQKMNHFSLTCRSNSRKLEIILKLEEQESTSNSEQLYVEQEHFYIGEIVMARRNEWLIQLKICNKMVWCKIDTGAEIKVMNTGAATRV